MLRGMSVEETYDRIRNALTTLSYELWVLRGIALVLFYFYGLLTGTLTGQMWELLTVTGASEGEDYKGVRDLGLFLVAVVGAPFVVYRSWVLGWQAETAEKQAALVEDRNFSDLFTRAVEQLGTDKTVKVRAENQDGAPVTLEETRANIEVRLGAIYALQRISRASEKDHIPVMQTLCAYIRENAIAGEPVEITEFDPEAFITLRSDVRAALSVIKERSVERRAYEQAQDFRLDFRHANLQRADLAKADFERADLSEARLEGAMMDGAVMNDAVMNWARMNHAKMDGAMMYGAMMDHAVMNWARMNGASLQSAKLTLCNIHSVNASFADFTGAQDLTQDQLDSCFGCAGTRIPDGLQRPGHWHPTPLDDDDKREAAYQAWLKTHRSAH